MGLVSRDASQTDMRAKEIKLTAKGRRLVEKVLGVHGRQIHAVLSGLAATTGGTAAIARSVGQASDALVGRRGQTGDDRSDDGRDD